MIVTRPPLGWNSWNTFGKDINEQLVRDSADAMVSSGLAAKGYEYIVIDDCWSLLERDENGRLVADPEKFPSGMKALADYVHSKGLKFGMYSCAGTLTCAGYPGSFDHEFIDAATFAEWGVDFLKYDYCYHSDFIRGDCLYRRMGLALENCGRDILFSACSWGADETHKWIKTTGAHMWRSTGDIHDGWESIKKLILKQDEILEYNGQGCFNDMDMLIVGMRGRGNVGFVGCTEEEYRTHMSMWAIMGSPLMIGCDIRGIEKDEETMNILGNEEMLRINQDSAYRQIYRVKGIGCGPEGRRIYVRHLEGGDIAIAMLNLSDEERTITLMLDELALPESCGKSLRLREVWSGEEYGAKNASIRAAVPAHGCKLFRASLVDVK
ncbi:MAG: glycoside hydrolase family 27 protein [Clostridia bacterium]|nr:glycoside hydrolase family 27 protein [Clostridia bacterium]